MSTPTLTIVPPIEKTLADKVTEADQVRQKILDQFHSCPPGNLKEMLWFRYKTACHNWLEANLNAAKESF